MSKALSILVVSFFCLFVSCSKTQNNEGENSKARELRTSLVTGKSSEEIRKIFNSASFETKQTLWADKMDYLLEQEFNDEIKQNIQILKNFIKDFGNKDKYEEFNEAVIRLAELVPSDDFSLMFESLDNYNFSGDFIGKEKVSKEFITHIHSLKSSYYMGGKIDPKVARLACHCRWCWFESVAGTTTRNCDESDLGCGFLWLQSCNRRGRS